VSSIPAKTRQRMLEGQVKAAGPQAMRVYRSIRRKGETAEFAAMCALRQPPGSKGTDRAFTEGFSRQMGGMSDASRSTILETARKAGIATQGKCFKGGLGRPDDPAAWVSSVDDVKAIARARNLTVAGAVEHQGVVPEKPKRTRLASDIVDRLEANYRAEDPSLNAKVAKSPKARRELRERIVDKHGSKKRD
jgi:hypothetical protein